MKKTVLLMLFALILGSSNALALRPRVILGPGTGSANFRVPYHQTWNRTLSKDTVYVLTGWYFVDSSYSITIQAGTVIRGDSASGGSLIIKRAAQIFASGTAAEPIIFTSNKAAGNRYPGDWGGVILLGRAPINQPEGQQIEGGFATIPNAAAPYGGYGIGLGDPNDNSGVLTYVRIEFAGSIFSQDNEINGLTFGGVGRGTTVHHIQVSYANDDDLEFFGGTADCKYVLTQANIDDNFDTDFGFSGRLQFVASFRDPNIFDASASGSSNGNESDNNDIENQYPPFPPQWGGGPVTHFKISNETLVGPLQDTALAGGISSHWGTLSMIRRNTSPWIYNSVIEGWPKGLTIRDSLTQRNASLDSLRYRYCSIASKSPTVRQDGAGAYSPGSYPGFNAISWFNTLAYHNNGCSPTGGGRQPADIGLINPAQSQMVLGTWDPRPSPGSEAATAGTSYTDLDSWFTPASYRGAFDPSLPMSQQWTAGWTQLDPQNYDPEATTTVNTSMNNGWNLVSLPVSPASSKPTDLFPGAVGGTIYSYLTGAYASPSAMAPGQGYWAFYSAAGSNSMTGSPVSTASVSVSTGNRWVLVGSVTSSKPVANLVSSPAGSIVSGTIYGYGAAGYAAPSTLDPGKGYWVFVNAPCTLTINP